MWIARCTHAQANRWQSVLSAATELATLSSVTTPVSINVAKLRKLDSSRMTGTTGSLYFTIALTRLDSTSGWYSFFREDTPSLPLAAREEVLCLDPGDAILWRGECVGKAGEGEGGLMLVITFRLPQVGNTGGETAHKS